MAAGFDISGIRISVVRKDIKNLYLSVRPPDGVVRIAAPRWMGKEAIRLFAINKLDWIKRQQKKLSEQLRETPREYIERESHYVWGKRCLLHVEEKDAAPTVELAPRKLILRIRPDTSPERRKAIVEHWYRAQIRAEVPALLARWEPLVGRQATRIFVRHMKTRWGSCNSKTGSIRLNTELAKKPFECLEYVVVHELVHLLERHHNDNFTCIMDKILPSWRLYRDELNRAPLAHEDWNY